MAGSATSLVGLVVVKLKIPLLRALVVISGDPCCYSNNRCPRLLGYGQIQPFGRERRETPQAPHEPQ